MVLKQKKIDYANKLSGLLQTYEKALIVNADNVSSQQIQDIRKSLRGNAEIIFGKNTLMKFVINRDKNPDTLKLLPHLKGNVGLVFTGGDLNEVRESLLSRKVQAPAKADAVAPKSVVIPKQQTNLGPEKTSFFQALQIPTKITRGFIEIINDVDLIKEGSIVKASQAAVLHMLKIYPFEYGLKITQVYESGSCYSADALDISLSDITNAFMKETQVLAAVSMAINKTTHASVAHEVVNSLKAIMAVSIAADIDLECTNEVREYLKDPSKFAVATAAPVVEKTAEAKEEKAKEPEPEESSDESDIGMGLFD